MVDKFYPFLGDIAVSSKWVKENRFQFYYMIDATIENPDYDFKLVQLGPISKFDIWSIKAMKEFEMLVPNKIDRYHHKNLPTGNLASGSFGVSRSTKNWDDRRKICGLLVFNNFN